MKKNVHGQKILVVGRPSRGRQAPALELTGPDGQPSFLRFLREALVNRNVELEFYNLHTKSTGLPPILDVNLVIIDASGISSGKLNWFYNLFQILQENNIPSLAFIPRNNIRLRYRLVEVGLDDYLTTPCDKLDIKIRITNILKRSSFEKTYSENTLAVTEQNTYRQFSIILDALIKPHSSFKMDRFLPHLLKTLKTNMLAQHILYFRVTENDTIILQHAVPTLPAKEQVETSISNLPNVIKSVRFKEATVLNQLTSGNPLYSHLKSFFNIDVKAFAMHPIVQNGITRFLLLVLRTDQEKFLEAEYRQIDMAAKLIQVALQKEETRAQLQLNRNGQVWKYSFEFLEHVINQLNFGIIVIDKERKIQYVNASSAHLLRVHKDEVLYRPLEEIIGAQNTGAILSAREQVKGAYERPEIELNAGEDDKILIGFNIMEFTDSENKEGGYIISLKDITYSKEMQEEMRRMDRLASLGVMASGIAHEIRNPLAGIKAIAQTFEEELQPDDPKNEFVKRIIKQVNRLDDMLKTLFSYSKPQDPTPNFTILKKLSEKCSLC